jgi:hypothetical protein
LFALNIVSSSEMCVRRPVSFAQFANVVRQLGLYWLLMNEPSPRSPQST